ncbi:ABC transporter ATP-binding protein [Candidatus Lokiarchaeum ossiferum]|uniref:ABC transporter ATP-binding protein n=1 Tax=Candidatus Lokiarchaeum ossiferum TaxID=2951803 RepID=UPI00352E4050
MAKLELRNIKMKYNDKLILDNLDLIVENGQILVLLGESGCGKTTLLKIICGIIEPEKGRIFVDDVDITGLNPQQRKIGYVPQSQVLFPHMSIKKNIEFGLLAQKFSKKVIPELISNVVNLTQIESILNRYPHEISGGQKQRVALARALVVSPKILLLDEPLSSIDASNRESLALMIQRVQRTTKTTILYVTHSQEEARLIADQIGIIHGGTIQQVDDYLSLRKYPKNYVIGKILGLDNLFSVSSFTTSENISKIFTDIGSIEFSIPIPSTITGIQLPPHLLHIHQIGFDAPSSDIPSPLSFQHQGKIISLQLGSNESINLIVEIFEPKPFYLKIFCASCDKMDSFSIDQKINVSILITDIIFL